MTITKIEPVSKTRFQIFLDGKPAFCLYRGELSRYHLVPGAFLEEEAYQKICEEVLVKRAKLRAMHLLEDMDRTEAGLREKLRQGEYPEEVTEKAIAYVRSFGYLNDARYAENFILSRQDTKSRREIEALLIKKGVAREIIDQAFSVCYTENGELEAVRKILRKKRFDPDSADSLQMQKIYGYLARKGFRYETIRQVIQNHAEDA